MIPTIKKLQVNDYLRLNFGCNWIVTGKYGSDVVHTLADAIRVWLWHCGLNPKLAFKKYKSNANIPKTRMDA